MSLYTQRLVSDIDWAEEAELRRIECGIGFDNSLRPTAGDPHDAVDLPDEDEYEEAALTAASALQAASPAYKPQKATDCTTRDADSPLSFSFEDEGSARASSPASPALSLPSEEWEGSPRKPASPEHAYTGTAPGQHEAENGEGAPRSSSPASPALSLPSEEWEESPRKWASPKHAYPDTALGQHQAENTAKEIRAVDWPLMGRRLHGDDGTSGSATCAGTVTDQPPPVSAAGPASGSPSLYRNRVCVEPLSGIALAVQGVAHEKLQCRLEESRASLFKLCDVAANAFTCTGSLATIGIIVKIENRKNSRGENCAQWSVSDLHPWTPSTLQLWLQGEAYRHAGKQGSRFSVGKVLALLRPKVLNITRLSDEQRGLVCSVNKADQLLLVGDAAELGRCPYKLGNRCCDVLIHRKKAEYCPGHMLCATSVPSTSRLDITGAPPPPPRNAGRGNLRPGLSSQPFRKAAGASRPELGRSEGGSARDAAREGEAFGVTANTKRTAQEELRKEFAKRRTSVGARNIVQQICAAQELEAQQREKERRRKALGPLPAGTNTAAAKAPTKAAPTSAADDGDMMCLDEDGELVSLEQAGDADQNAKERRFTWQEVMPLPAVAPGRLQETTADAVRSIFGDVTTTEDGGELLRQVRGVAERNARLSAASLM